MLVASPSSLLGVGVVLRTGSGKAVNLAGGGIEAVPDGELDESVCIEGKGVFPVIEEPFSLSVWVDTVATTFDVVVVVVVFAGGGGVLVVGGGVLPLLMPALTLPSCFPIAVVALVLVVVVVVVVVGLITCGRLAGIPGRKEPTTGSFGAGALEALVLKRLTPCCCCGCC